MQEDDLALAFRQTVEWDANGRRVFCNRRRSVCAALCPATGIASRVDDDPPDPRLERPPAVEPAPCAHRSGERILYCVMAEVDVPCNRGGDAPELGQMLAIQKLELVDHLTVRRPATTNSLDAAGRSDEGAHRVLVDPVAREAIELFGEDVARNRRVTGRERRRVPVELDADEPFRRHVLEGDVVATEP